MGRTIIKISSSFQKFQLSSNFLDVPKQMVLLDTYYITNLVNGSVHTVQSRCLMLIGLFKDYNLILKVVFLFQSFLDITVKCTMRTRKLWNSRRLFISSLSFIKNCLNFIVEINSKNHKTVEKEDDISAISWPGIRCYFQ